jgi:hypothetical protein
MMTSVLTATLVIIVLLFATGLLSHVPIPALSAVVMLAVKSLILDLRLGIHLLRDAFQRKNSRIRNNTKDADIVPNTCLWWLTFLAVVLLDVDVGLAVGTGLALFFFVYSRFVPRLRSLFYIPFHHQSNSRGSFDDGDDDGDHDDNRSNGGVFWWSDAKSYSIALTDVPPQLHANLRYNHGMSRSRTNLGKEPPTVVKENHHCAPLNGHDGLELHTSVVDDGRGGIKKYDCLEKAFESTNSLNTQLSSIQTFLDFIDTKCRNQSCITIEDDTQGNDTRDTHDDNHVRIEKAVDPTSWIDGLHIYSYQGPRWSLSLGILRLLLHLHLCRSTAQYVILDLR